MLERESLLVPSVASPPASKRFRWCLSLVGPVAKMRPRGQRLGEDRSGGDAQTPLGEPVAATRLRIQRTRAARRRLAVRRPTCARQTPRGQARVGFWLQPERAKTRKTLNPARPRTRLERGWRSNQKAAGMRMRLDRESLLVPGVEGTPIPSRSDRCRNAKAFSIPANGSPAAPTCAQGRTRRSSRTRVRRPRPGWRADATFECLYEQLAMACLNEESL